MFKKDDKVPEALISFFNLAGGTYGEVERSGPFRVCVVAKTRKEEYPSYIYIDPGYDTFPFEDVGKAYVALRHLTQVLRRIGLDIETEQVYGKTQETVCYFDRNISETEVVGGLTAWGSITQEMAEELEAASFGFSERHLEPVTKEWKLRV